jgi:hypothetical protein
MTPTEAPLRRALSTMAEQVEVVDLAGRVDAQLRRRRRRARVATLLAAACVASVVTGVLLQSRDGERALPAHPGPVVHLDEVALGYPESARLVVSGEVGAHWALSPHGHWIRMASLGVTRPCRTLSADGRTVLAVLPAESDRVDVRLESVAGPKRTVTVAARRVGPACWAAPAPGGGLAVAFDDAGPGPGTIPVLRLVPADPTQAPRAVPLAGHIGRAFGQFLPDGRLLVVSGTPSGTTGPDGLRVGVLDTATGQGGAVQATDGSLADGWAVSPRDAEAVVSVGVQDGQDRRSWARFGLDGEPHDLGHFAAPSTDHLIGWSRADRLVWFRTVSEGKGRYDVVETGLDGGNPRVLYRLSVPGPTSWAAFAPSAAP